MVVGFTLVVWKNKFDGHAFKPVQLNYDRRDKQDGDWHLAHNAHPFNWNASTEQALKTSTNKYMLHFFFFKLIINTDHYYVTKLRNDNRPRLRLVPFYLLSWDALAPRRPARKCVAFLLLLFNAITWNPYHG